ncbi:MAG: hypothetical protein LBI72_02195 [Flavobacteriaceae bacterium]|jgi:uncharacterized protein RhaS with RHS repeats|nr:hypothetical protein [Flavobacteriaceae bacterium]
MSIFLSVDPLAEQFPNWNPYHYVHNNPINLVDPTGMSAEWIPGTDDKAISYSRNEKGEVTWSSNTSDKMKEVGNAMLKTVKGTEQLNKAINSKDVRVDVVVNEGRHEGESGPYGNVTYGITRPIDVEYDSNGIPQKITSAKINLYPKAYEEVVNFISANPKSKNAFDTAYDGHIINAANYSIMENTSTTFGHEIEHVFDPVSSSYLNNVNNRSNNSEENPNKISRQIYQQLDSQR